MSMMKKLLEAMTKFAGEPEQKPGDQVRGTDVAKVGTKEHPFKGKLVGSADESVLKDLAKGPTPKTKEQELAEEWAKFMEDDIGVEPKRPGRKSDRPIREYTKHGKPSKRYTTVENNELNEYKKDTDNFTADDIKELEGIKDLATLKARAFALISKPSARPMKPEKVQWFKNRLDSLVSPMAVIKLMYDLLLSGEGQRVIGSRSSMGANSYRSRFNEGWNTGSDRVTLPDSPHTYWSGTGALQKEYDALYNELVPSQGKADTIEGEVLRASSKIVYRHYNDGDLFNEASFDQLEPYIGAVANYDDLAHKAIEFALKANGNYTPNPDWDSLDVMDYGPAEDDYEDEEDEEDDWYDDEEVDEGRGPSKGLHKKVTIVKGRDAGKTGYVRQIKTDKLKNRVYLDLDLEDGGQAVVLKQDVRLVKDLAENYTGRETKDGVWRVFKDGQGGSVAGPFKSAEEANAWIKKQNQGVVEARTTWNNDFYVYDPKTKTVKKKFRTHKGATQYAEANGLKVASAEYYHDSVSKEVDEGWESGPEERSSSRERDPDAEYDARRQEKADAEADAAQAKRPQTKVYTLSGRGPNNEPNYEFPGEYATQDEAVVARAKLMADPSTPNPRDIGIRAQTKYLGEGIESNDPVEGAVLAAVQELIQQGHTEVAPEVITNMVVAATSQPFLLKDLVDCNNNSPAIQHYVDSINPTKVKFSNEILTVKNEDPMKDKKQAQAGVSSMAARAANRNRLGETKSISELSTDLVTKVGTARAQQLAPHVASNSTSPDRLKFAIKKNKAVDNLLAKSRAANEKGDTASAQKAVAGVLKIRDTVDGISEGSETPLRDKEDYAAKRSALQQIQMDPDTHKDPQLKAELVRRLGSLNQQYSDLQNKLREFKESRGHKVIATKLGNMDRMNTVQIPTPAERQEQIRLRKEKEAGKKPVKEFAAPGANPATPVTTTAKPAVDPVAAAKASAATNTLKAATGTTVAPATLDKALDSATMGTATSTDVKALAPIMGVLNKAAEDPKLATQFKAIANQAKLTP
jgi:hypothetical protein